MGLRVFFEEGEVHVSYVAVCCDTGEDIIYGTTLQDLDDKLSVAAEYIYSMGVKKVRVEARLDIVEETL
jgi:hypothetical protein